MATGSGSRHPGSKRYLFRGVVPSNPKPRSSTSLTSSRQPLKATYRNYGTCSRQSEVKFYDTYGQYGEFTNFYPCRNLVIDGVDWRTTEHYFQAQKFVGTPYVEHIRLLRTAREAFQFAREHKVQSWIRSDWHFVKKNFMKKALLNKFLQNESFKRKLLETGEKKLVEHTFNDSYWGDGGDGTGENHLGRLLMEVRDTLKYEQKSLQKQKSHQQQVAQCQDYQSKNTGRKTVGTLKRSNSLSNVHIPSCSTDSHIDLTKLSKKKQPSPQSHYI